MSSKNITYGPSEQELIPAGVTQLFFPILWFIIHSITCYTDCHFSLNVFDKRLLVLLGQVLLFINIMYQPARTPAAAAEPSLNIRVSAGLLPATLWSHEMGEQLKGKQLPVASLCRAGHTHSHDPYRSRKLQSVENGHAFPQHGPSERFGATFAPHWPCSRLPLTQVCACNCWWLHVNPLLYLQLRPALTNFPQTLQVFAAQQRQRHCHERGTRNKTCPCHPAALAVLNHQHAQQRGWGPALHSLCASKCSQPCAWESSVVELSKGRRLSLRFLPVLRCTLICS